MDTFSTQHYYLTKPKTYCEIRITGKTYESKEWLKAQSYSWDPNNQWWYKITTIKLYNEEEFQRRDLNVKFIQKRSYSLFAPKPLETVIHEYFQPFTAISTIVKVIGCSKFIFENTERFISRLLITDLTKSFRLIVWDKLDFTQISPNKLYHITIDYAKNYNNELQLYCESATNITELEDECGDLCIHTANNSFQSWIQENSIPITNINKQNNQSVIITGVITDMYPLSLYSACETCNSKVVTTETYGDSYCLKCQKQVRTQTSLFSSIIVQDKSNAIEVRCYRETIIDLLDLAEQVPLLDPHNPLDILENDKLHKKIINLIGAKISLECYMSQEQEQEREQEQEQEREQEREGDLPDLIAQIIFSVEQTGDT